MFKFFVTRESCFAAALYVWLSAPVFGIVFLVMGKAPLEHKVPVALAIGLAVGAVLSVIARRLEYVQGMRDRMCEFGTGWAQSTQVACSVKCQYCHTKL
jgi:hypothetical protein